MRLKISVNLCFCKNRLSEKYEANFNDYCLCVEIPLKAKLSIDIQH